MNKTEENINPDAHVCPWWMAYFFDNPLRGLIHNPRKILSSWLKPGMTAVDLGCGMGFFSIGMARIVGIDGRVIAADLQQKMLDITIKRAKRAGVDGIISTYLCQSESLDIEEKIDFALACWVVHEVPYPKQFLTEVYDMLNPEGHFLMAEPSHHVSKAVMDTFVKTAQEIGFEVVEKPKMIMSRTAVLRKGRIAK
ncbi:MAG: methyltransferase domain-containing protein [Candidatus Hatepunaea meridiana]|nr:methyltransferase domain-containing protein [Candidatus Hatepunaea meridiana]